jgi:DNA-binding transcriptional LysR family regulator
MKFDLIRVNLYQYRNDMADIGSKDFIFEMSRQVRLPKLQLIQSFSRVAEHGSLAATVKALGGSPATLSRHISTLESDLGVTLFERRVDGLSLTETGIALYAYASDLTQAAHRFAAAAAERDQAIVGTVRIAASKGVAGFLLPKVLERFAREEPDIEFELVPSDTEANLLLREADIAIRMFRPRQSKLIARKLGDLGLVLFATQDYLDRHGTPLSVTDLAQHDLIGGDADGQVLEGLRSLGVDIDREGFRYRCDDRFVAWQLLVAGCGVGAAHLAQGKSVPDLVRVLPNVPAMRLPVWLASHSELKTNARVRRTYDYIAGQLSADLKAQSL